MKIWVVERKWADTGKWIAYGGNYFTREDARMAKAAIESHSKEDPALRVRAYERVENSK